MRLGNEWAPAVGDRVYVEQEQQSGHVIRIEMTDGVVVYIV
jgi:hypothetical protein